MSTVSIHTIQTTRHSGCSLLHAERQLQEKVDNCQKDQMLAAT